MPDQVEAVLRLQTAVLEKIAAGAKVEETLTGLCSLVEGAVPGSICSVMLLRPDGTLGVAAAPQAPAELIRQLDGLVPSDMAGSCGTAVFQQRPVFVGDTAADPRWSTMREVARQFKIGACWSVPIVSREGTVLGSFAISHLERREPTAFHERILKTASHLASVAVERSQVDQAMQQAQKLESLGVLAGGIAHDFNNLLVGILGNAHLALAHTAPEATAASSIRRIKVAGERASELVSQLLAYAGRGKVCVQTVDLRGVLEEIIQLLRSGVPRTIALESRAHDAPLWIRADVTQVRQVAMNLVTNAAESIDSGTGTVQVSTGVMTASADWLRRCAGGSDLQPGEYAYLEVRDSGAGMDQETVERIFDPFFTTKTSGRGLGLAATIGIVRGHGGALVIDSRPGAGSTFRVLFPRAPAAELPAPARPAAPDGGAGDAPAGTTILVVDDEELVREVTEQSLSRAGFRVVTAADGNSAVQILRRLDRAIDAVVLDGTMPGMSGEATFQALRGIRGDLPVLFCSGHGALDGAGLVANRPHTAFVAKPYSPAALCAQLALLLTDGPRRA